jgi:hypothetical protein
MALLEDAGLSLAQEQKNFYDYLHFTPIKVCIFFLKWYLIWPCILHIYHKHFNTQWRMLIYLWFRNKKTSMITYTSLLSRFVLFLNWYRIWPCILHKHFNIEWRMLVYLWPRKKRTSMITYTSLLSRFVIIFELIPYLAFYIAHLP